MPDYYPEKLGYSSFHNWRIEGLNRKCHHAGVSNTGERGSRYLQWLGVACFFYLAPALVLLIDTTVFSCRFWDTLSPEAQQVLNTIYWPVGEMLRPLFAWRDSCI